MDNTVGSDKSIFTQILREFNEDAKRNGTSEMTLEEINAEIDAARRESEELEQKQKQRRSSSISEILKRANAEAERNGLSDMSLEEINAEIDAAREERLQRERKQSNT